MKKENVLLRRLLPRVKARVRCRLGICQFVFQTGGQLSAFETNPK